MEVGLAGTEPFGIAVRFAQKPQRREVAQVPHSTHLKIVMLICPKSDDFGSTRLAHFETGGDREIPLHKVRVSDSAKLLRHQLVQRKKKIRPILQVRKTRTVSPQLFLRPHPCSPRWEFGFGSAR